MPQPLTTARLLEIEKRLCAATPAPWVWRDWEVGSDEEEDFVRHVPVLTRWSETEGAVDILPYDGSSPWDSAHCDGLADGQLRYVPNAEFIAHAPQDVRDLLDEVWRVRAVIAAVVESHRQHVAEQNA